MTTLLTYMRAFVALLTAFALVQLCPCEPCSPASLLAQPVGESVHHAASASDEDAPLAKKGCCPGDDEDDGNDAHACAHCDTDSAWSAAQVDLQIHALGGFGPLSFVPPSAATHDFGTTWRPIVQPIVVQRANPPPLDLPPRALSERLAYLAVYRC